MHCIAVENLVLVVEQTSHEGFPTKVRRGAMPGGTYFFLTKPKQT